MFHRDLTDPPGRVYRRALCKLHKVRLSCCTGCSQGAAPDCQTAGGHPLYGTVVRPGTWETGLWSTLLLPPPGLRKPLGGGCSSLAFDGLLFSILPGVVGHPAYSLRACTDSRSA